MKIEITYDTIAKKIFEKGSEEDKLFSRATRLVKERFDAAKDTKTYLTERELEFIESQYEALEATLTKEEFSFITTSQRQQKMRLYRKLSGYAMTGFIIGMVALFLFIYYSDKLKYWSGIDSEAEYLVSEALQIMDNDPTYALHLAGEALEIDPKNVSAKQVIYLLYRDNIFYKNILTNPIDSISANAVAFSPNSKLIAFAERDFVYVKDIDKTSIKKKRIHKGTINDLVFDSDTTLISVGDDNRIMRWSFDRNGVKEIAHTNRTMIDSTGFNIDINAIDVSYDGKYIFIGRGAKGSDCLLVDLENDTTLVIDDVDGRVHDVIFTTPNPDATLPILQERLLMMAGDDKRILIYNLQGKLLAESFPEDHPKSVFSLDLRPNSNQVVTACNHDVIRVFELEKNDNPKISTLPYILKLQNRLTEHSDAVRSVRFSKNGLQMVSASYDNTAIIWDVKRWEPLYTLKGHTGKVFKAEFSNDSRYIATIGRDYRVMIWNLKLKKADTKSVQHLRRVSALQYSRNGKRAFSGTWGNENTPKRSLITWNAATWLPVEIDSFDNDIEAIASFYQDSLLVAIGKSLYLVDNKFKRQKEIGKADGTIKAVAIAPNNSFIAYAGRDDKVRIIPHKRKRGSSSSINRKKVLTIRKDNVEISQDGDIYSISISPDSRYIVIGRRNRTIVIWDIQENVQLMPPILAHDYLYKVDNEIYSVNFVDNTKFLTIGRDNTIRLWQIKRDEKKVSLVTKTKGHAGGIRCLAVHPSLSLYITGGGDRLIKLWDLEGNLIQVIDAYFDDEDRCTGDEYKCNEDFGVVTGLAFSKDGSKIVIGNGNGKVKSIYTIEGALSKNEIYTFPE